MNLKYRKRTSEYQPSLLIRGIEDRSIFADDLHVRRRVLNTKVRTLRDASSVARPERLAVAVDDEVAILLEDEREVGALRVAGGRGDGDASGLVRDEVAVLLEEDLDAVGEAEGGLVAGGDAEVGELEFG